MGDQDGHWSDTQATAETDETSVHEEPQCPVEEVAAQDEQDLSITPQKVTSEDDKRPLSPSSGVAIDSPSPAEQPEDVRSVQSLPVVRVTEPSETSSTAQDTPASMDVQRPLPSPRLPRTPTSPHDPRSSQRASPLPEVSILSPGPKTVLSLLKRTEPEIGFLASLRTSSIDETSPLPLQTRPCNTRTL